MTTMKTTTTTEFDSGTVARRRNNVEDDEAENDKIMLVNVMDYQQKAAAESSASGDGNKKKKIMSRALYEYLASGTGNEQTLRENRRAFDGYYLRPRVLRPVGDALDCSTLFFGRKIGMPVFVSPAGVQALVCHDPDDVLGTGECATARSCCLDVHIPFGLSQHATRSIEQVRDGVAMMAAESTMNPTTTNLLLWYQSYILKDRSRTERLIKRAICAGYSGIFLTVDSVRFGFREADARNGFNALPPPHRLANYDEDDSTTATRAMPGISSTSTATATTTTAASSSSLDATYNSQKESAWDQNTEQMFESDVTWDDVKWLKSVIARYSPGGKKEIPLVIKGIMTAEDALLAAEAGADGIMVSNHGGRQLDGCLSTIDALPEVVAAVRGRNIPVLLDGGVRRGIDVIKALALGATAVGLGKPVFFALHEGGRDAVTRMLRILQTELQAAMAICGCRTIQDITPSLVLQAGNNTRQQQRQQWLHSAL